MKKMGTSAFCLLFLISHAAFSQECLTAITKNSEFEGVQTANTVPIELIRRPFYSYFVEFLTDKKGIFAKITSQGGIELNQDDHVVFRNTTGEEQTFKFIGVNESVQEPVVTHCNVIQLDLQTMIWLSESNIENVWFVNFVERQKYKFSIGNIQQLELKRIASCFYSILDSSLVQYEIAASRIGIQYNTGQHNNSGNPTTTGKVNSSADKEYFLLKEIRILQDVLSRNPASPDSVAGFKKGYSSCIRDFSYEYNKKVLTSYSSLRNQVESCFLNSLESLDLPKLPKPTTFYSIGGNVLFHKSRQSDPQLTLYDVKEIAEQCLHDCGYSELTYGRIPGGFMAITRIEQLDESGTPLKGNDRWNSLYPVRPLKDGWDYLKALFLPKTGRYRMLMLAITNVPMEFEEKVVEKKEAEKMRAMGTTSLAAPALNTKVDKHYYCTVLFYEFESTGSGPAEPARVPFDAKLQLERNNLLPHLEIMH